MGGRSRHQSTNDLILHQKSGPRSNSPEVKKKVIKILNNKMSQFSSE